MSDQLRIEMGELEALWQNLLHVSIAFGDIEYANSSLEDAVGNDVLRSRVHDFQAGWDDRRKKIVASLDTVWRSLQAIENTFEQVDTKLASVLVASTAAKPTGGTP